MTIRQKGVDKPYRKKDTRSGNTPSFSPWRAVSRALTSWSSTFRALLLVTAPIVILIAAVWLFRMNVEIGPVRVSHI